MCSLPMGEITVARCCSLHDFKRADSGRVLSQQFCLFWERRRCGCLLGSQPTITCAPCAVSPTSYAHLAWQGKAMPLHTSRVHNRDSICNATLSCAKRTERMFPE